MKPTISFSNKILQKKLLNFPSSPHQKTPLPFLSSQCLLRKINSHTLFFLQKKNE